MQRGCEISPLPIYKSTKGNGMSRMLKGTPYQKEDSHIKS